MTVVVGLLAVGRVSSAAAQPATLQYGATAGSVALVYPAGRVPLILLHMRGETAYMIRGKAEALQAAGFTVFNLEWEEPRGEGGIFPADTNQIEAAVTFIRTHAPQLGVDMSKLVMLGGSRGALIALLTAELENNLQPGTVKAVVALSAQVDPQKSIERARAGELAEVMTGTLANTFGCTKELLYCDESYVKEWSPVEKVNASSPAMLLAASESERKASLEDQYEMAERLAAVGVRSEVAVAPSGHGFAYFGQVKAQSVAYLKSVVGS